MIEYRPILGFPDYAVSNEGTVVSFLSGAFRIRKTPLSKKGYPMVILKGERAMKTFYVHTLVLHVFCGPRPVGMEARHINGIKTDNRIENLSWGTPKENFLDRIHHGTHVPLKRRVGRDAGEKTSKIDDAVAAEIYTSNERGFVMARKFGVSKYVVSGIRRGISWKHVTSNLRTQ